MDGEGEDNMLVDHQRLKDHILVVEDHMLVDRPLKVVDRPLKRPDPLLPKADNTSSPSDLVASSQQTMLEDMSARLMISVEDAEQLVSKVSVMDWSDEVLFHVLPFWRKSPANFDMKKRIFLRARHRAIQAYTNASPLWKTRALKEEHASQGKATAVMELCHAEKLRELYLQRGNKTYSSFGDIDYTWRRSFTNPQPLELTKDTLCGKLLVEVFQLNISHEGGTHLYGTIKINDTLIYDRQFNNCERFSPKKTKNSKVFKDFARPQLRLAYCPSLWLQVGLDFETQYQCMSKG